MYDNLRMQSVQSPIIPVVGELIRNNPGTISLGQGVAYYGPPPQAVESIQKFEIEIFQIIHAIEMIGYFRAVKPRVGRGNDLEFLGKFVGKGLVGDRSATAMKQQ